MTIVIPHEVKTARIEMLSDTFDKLQERYRKEQQKIGKQGSQGGLVTCRKMEQSDAKDKVHKLGGHTALKYDQNVTHLVTGVQAPGRQESSNERKAKKRGDILIPIDVFFTLIGH